MPRFTIPIRLRWADLDAYGHVNNAVLLRLLEEARIQAFWANDRLTAAPSPLGHEPTTALIDGSPGSDTLTLIARQEIEYLAPIPYLREPISIQMWLCNLGGASLEICYEVWSPEGTHPAVLYAHAASTAVLVDAVTLRPRRLTQAERTAWEPYLDPRPVFRTRSWR